MTVSQVYKELKEVGLLEARRATAPSSPRSVADAAPPGGRWACSAHRSIDRRGHGGRALRRRARRPVQCPHQPPHAHGQRFRGRGLRLVFVGLFDEATRAYGAEIRSHLPEGDRIQTTTLGEIAASDVARRRARQCRSRADPRSTARRRWPTSPGPKKPVLGVRFIPVRAHPHPARPDRSPARASASSRPSRSSCRS